MSTTHIKNDYNENNQNAITSFPSLNIHNNVENNIVSTFPKQNNQNKENEDIKFSIRKNFYSKISSMIEQKEENENENESDAYDSIFTESSIKFNDKKN